MGGERARSRNDDIADTPEDRRSLKIRFQSLRSPVGFGMSWIYDRWMVWHVVDVSGEAHSASVRLAGTEVLIAKVDDSWFAVENRCSHTDCSFTSDGEIDGASLICNCHGSEFDVRTGEVLVGPAADHIRTFPVRNADGGLEVEV